MSELFAGMNINSHVFKSLMDGLVYLFNTKPNGQRNYYEIYRDSVDGIKLTSGYFTRMSYSVEKINGFTYHLITLTHSFGIIRMRLDELVDYSTGETENNLTFIVNTK